MCVLGEKKYICISLIRPVTSKHPDLKQKYHYYTLIYNKMSNITYLTDSLYSGRGSNSEIIYEGFEKLLKMWKEEANDTSRRSHRKQLLSMKQIVSHDSCSWYSLYLQVVLIHSHSMLSSF